MSRVQYVISGIAALAIIGCGGDAQPNISGIPAVNISQVIVSPKSLTIYVSDTIRTQDHLQMSAVVLNRAGAPIVGAPVVWQSLDPAVAVVDATGILTPRSFGTARIVASASKADTALITIAPAANRVVVLPGLASIEVEVPTLAGDTLNLRARAFDAAGDTISGARFGWTSSNPAVATVDSTGHTHAVTTGETTITAKNLSSGVTGTATLQVVPIVKQIIVTPPTGTITVDDPIGFADSLRTTATGLDARGVPFAGALFTYTSSQPGVATVDATGRVQAVTLGTTTITVRNASSGLFSAVPVKVQSVVQKVTLTSPEARVLARDTVQLLAVATGQTGQTLANRTWVFTTSDANVATVDSSGRAIFLKQGAATFTATTGFITSSQAAAVSALPRELVQISAGGDATCGVAPNGRGYCWGLGDVGQLASPADSSCFNGTTALTVECTLLPKRFASTAVQFAQVSAGVEFACGISTSQSVYCWGSDTVGQIGNGRKGAGSTPSLATALQEKFSTVSAGGAHACAISVISKHAWCWGWDFYGQLGEGSLQNVNSSTPIEVSGGISFAAISAGGSHTCGLDTNGVAFCWGANQSGQLGVGDTQTRLVPTRVTGGATFVAIGASASGDPNRAFSCGLTGSGQIMCWGAGSRGQLGNGAATASSTPVVVTGSGFSALAVGGTHACGVSTAGIMCWGQYDLAASATAAANTIVPSPAPIALPVASPTITAITSGRGHSCAIVGPSGSADVYCWGGDVYGALGDEEQALFRTAPKRKADLRR